MPLVPSPERQTASLSTAHDAGRGRLLLLAQLASAISHDLHNPLNTISLHLDVLDEELRQPGEGNRDQLLDSLAVLQRGVTCLDDVMQEFLALVRLPVLSCEPEEVGGFLEGFRLELRDRLTAHGISLRLEGTADLGTVALHHNTFRRALLNVILYTLNSLPPGETLTIRGRRTEAQVCLDISGMGRALPEAQWAALFDPCHVAEAEGVGLGLYFTREIVLAHHGEMAVTSAPDRGTTFTIMLPLLALGDGRT
jgi:two-component system, sporulation sensor kinase E